MIDDMRAASSTFYAQAFQIGNPPFIEICGLMNEYIDCCQKALKNGIDFTRCNTHSGKHLPMTGFQIDYINEKLDCIFTGRSVMQQAS